MRFSLYRSDRNSEIDMNRFYELMTSVIFVAGEVGSLCCQLLRKGDFFMLLSLALIFLCGIGLCEIFSKLKLPGLLGMIAAGMILGPHVMNIIDPTVLSISSDLRQIALIIILTRAGLNLDVSDLKKVGRSAVLMCFVPACFEIAGIVALAPHILGLTMTEAFLLGTVIAAVSPAVVVPRMLRLMDEKYGVDKGVPQMILAGASVDDVFVIVLFTSATGIVSGERFNALNLVRIPTSIILGIAGGILCGVVLNWLFRRSDMRDSLKIVIVISISFLLVTLDGAVTGYIGFSGLLSVMSMGLTLRIRDLETAQRLSLKYSKLWVAAELLLFVLVGAAVDIRYAMSSGMSVVLLIVSVLFLRMTGVFVCLLGAKLSLKEKIFCMLAYTPKATVQAAIGSVPLTMGLACGNTVLTVAVVSILITAPFGALAIDLTYKKFLKKSL